MDPDSFLNLLSPGLNELTGHWPGSPFDADFFSAVPPLPPCPPPLAWLSDGFSVDCMEHEEEEEDPPAASATALNSFATSSIVANASEYSSVLKLSDIASALHSFSKVDEILGRRKRLHAQKTSHMQNCSTVHPPASSLRDSRNGVIAVHAPTQLNVCTANSSRCNSVSGPDNYQCNYSGKEREDVDDEDDDVDNEVDEDEDVKPCVSHVRIIRRPNSNCGQTTAWSPKRMRFTNVKAETTSSCETASSQEDKDGGGRMKQTRKEGMSQREVHILSERQRRKSMRESFSILQSLVPKLKIKHIDRATVLTEVITYIQSLRGTLEELERKKLDIMDLLGLSAKPKPRRCQADTPATVTYVNTSNDSSSDDKVERSGGWCSLQNGELVAMVEVTVRMCGSDVFITLNTPHHKGVWSGVLSLLQKLSIEVSNATLATSGDSSFHCINGKVTNMSNIEGVDLQEKLEGVVVKELRRHPRK